MHSREWHSVGVSRSHPREPNVRSASSSRDTFEHSRIRVLARGWPRRFRPRPRAWLRSSDSRDPRSCGERRQGAGAREGRRPRRAPQRPAPERDSLTGWSPARSPRNFRCKASVRESLVDHDRPHPRLERRLALVARPPSDRLPERVLHGIPSSPLVADDRRGCPHEAWELGSVERLQCFGRGPARRHLNHPMRGARGGVSRRARFSTPGVCSVKQRGLGAATTRGQEMFRRPHERRAGWEWWTGYLLSGPSARGEHLDDTRARRST